MNQIAQFKKNKNFRPSTQTSNVSTNLRWYILPKLKKGKKWEEAKVVWLKWIYRMWKEIEMTWWYDCKAQTQSEKEGPVENMTNCTVGTVCVTHCLMSHLQTALISSLIGPPYANAWGGVSAKPILSLWHSL